MCGIWMYLFNVLGLLVTPGVYRVAAVEISAPKELKVVNGTEVELHCTFRSSQPHSKRLSVTWNFRPYGQTTEETIFYYQEMPYLPTDGRFKDHVVWTGDVQKNDASITLHGVQFAFNGTFSCKVQNPPDIQGYSGETVLQVIQSVKLSEIEILAAAVGGAIILVIFILIIFITVRYCRQDRNSTEVVLRDTEWKQPSVCALEEDVTLKITEKDLDTDSVSGEEMEDHS
ncbi:myelin protein zero-like protein 2b [Electrophorus electricus]|uniref:myelin protein zero-like protein 2b n=1 Tax=Electrophorus electricus TaxID=8005 RepID=UPI0015D08550|nr:myelin protein zero-like protein 2b [Electrophorus electricus]